MRQKMLSAILALVLSVSLLPGAATAAESDFKLANGDTCLYGYDGPGGDVVVPAGPFETSQAFQDNTEITSVTLPSGFTKIGLGTFTGCTNLERVVLPAGLTEIAGGSFSGCTTLREIVIPDTVTTIGTSAFSGCTSLERVTFPRDLKVLGDLGSLFGVFQDCTSLKEVVLPDGLETLGRATFQNCTALTSVTIPESVTEMGYDLFEGCTSLTRVTVGDRTVDIGAGEKKDYSHFGTAQELDTAFVVEDHVLVGPETYADHVLTKYVGPGGAVTVPDGVEVIDGLVFRDRDDITSVTLPQGLKEIGYVAFSGCTGLKELSMPDSVVRVEDDAFENCTSLETIRLSAGLKEMGAGLFRNCTSLREVTIPEGVTTIGDSAFYGCTALEKISFPQSLTQYEGGFLSAKGELNALPTRELRGLFTRCSSLEEISGFPNQELMGYLKENQAQYRAWVNPGACLTPQSEAIKSQAVQIAGEISDPYEKALAIYSWVVDHVEYDYDYYEGRKSTVLTEPDAVLSGLLTVCDGYARLTAALLQAQGIPAMYVSGPAYGTKGWEPHAWTEAFVDGRWVLIDATFGDQDLKVNFGGSEAIWKPSLLDYFDIGLVGLSCEHQYSYRPTASADDTPSAWARDEVWTAICADLVPYDLQGAYRADITREEFCRLMVALVEEQTGQSIDAYLAAKGLKPADAFTDTDSAPVLAACALGIVKGTGDGTTFTPGGSITRQEAAVMLARTAKVLGSQGGSAAAGFRDEAAFASWAAADIKFLAGLTDPSGRQVMGSTGDGSFSPTASYSREQAALTALRLFQCR